VDLPPIAYTSVAQYPGGVLYLELMKRCLTDLIYAGHEGAAFDPQLRSIGRDWPVVAHTMIGLRRLENIQFCVEDVIANRVPGDLIETGVWRGGAAIFMRAILKAYGVRDRAVWVADSFQGLPPPNPAAYPLDAGDLHHTFSELAISLDQVRANFAAYDLLDDQVHFLEGWFRDSLPASSTGPIAVARLDGDMYESTTDGLVNLYPRVSPGGYVIIDDYGAIPACRQAVDDFRSAHAIADPMIGVDWTGVYWQRTP
jgi:O-methyltransferase